MRGMHPLVAGARGDSFSGKRKRESGKEGEYSCLVLAGQRSMDQRRDALSVRTSARCLLAMRDRVLHTGGRWLGSAASLPRTPECTAGNAPCCFFPLSNTCIGCTIINKTIVFISLSRELPASVSASGEHTYRLFPSQARMSSTTSLARRC